MAATRVSPQQLRVVTATRGPSWFAAAICGYEVAAITTGKIPTLTHVCARYRPLGPALVALLAVHLYRQPRGEPIHSYPLPAMPVPATPRRA